MRRAILAAALLCALALPAHASTMSINSWDPGGEIETYEMWWKRIAASGVNVRINGPCVSSCSMVLGLVPASRICITARGKFGIHMASIDDVPNKRMTRKFVRAYYPQWVQAWLKTKPPLTDDLTWLTPRDIGGRLKRCK
jgi:hypothetical protein